jgi:hypothetical protein
MIFNQCRSDSTRQEVTMIDDLSLALAQAFERVAVSAAHARFCRFDLEACRTLGASNVVIARNRESLAEAESEQETAVRELAAQLAAWKAAS